MARIRVDHRAGFADVTHARTRPQHEDVHHVLERCAGRVQGLLDAVHRAPGLRLQVVGHVLLDLVALVRMIVIDRQGGRAGKPQNLSALDLDRRHERHEDVLVVVGMMDDLHVLALRSRRYRRERRDREYESTHASGIAQYARRLAHRFSPVEKIVAASDYSASAIRNQRTAATLSALVNRAREANGHRTVALPASVCVQGQYGAGAPPSGSPRHEPHRSMTNRTNNPTAIKTASRIPTKTPMSCCRRLVGWPGFDSAPACAAPSPIQK